MHKSSNYSKKRERTNSTHNSCNFMHNSLRRSYIQVTSKSKDVLQRKSLLNLTIHNPKNAAVKGKENNIFVNFSKEEIKLPKTKSSLLPKKSKPVR